MGREQIGEGSNALDVCTAFVGRDEVAEMNEVIRRFTSSVNAPLVIDSTEAVVLESGAEAAWRQADHQLDQFRGRREARRSTAWILAKKFGAAVIALTIDETGMAKTPDRQARRRRAAGGFRLQPSTACRTSDLLIDPLTFTIATGNEDDRKLGQWTLEGIAA